MVLGAATAIFSISVNLKENGSIIWQLCSIMWIFVAFLKQLRIDDLEKNK